MKLLLLLLIPLFALVSYAAIPQTINVHGILTNSTGGAENGSFTMVFKIWDSYSGGSQLWNETKNVTTDDDGIYSEILHSVDVDFTSQRYLSIKVNNDSDMTPRINFTSVPSALYSNSSTFWNSVDDWVTRWFYNNGGSLGFNETLLNATIDSRAVTGSADTHVAGDGVYLTNDSTTMYFDESKLNDTIDAREHWENDTDTLWAINTSVLNNESGVLGIVRDWWNNLFIAKENESNLNVNSSNYWDSLDTPADIALSLLSPSSLDITGYTLTTSYLSGVVGTIDMRGDPWYLSGTDFQLANSLIVDGNASATWFKGKFNWTSGDSYTSFDGLTLLFNETKMNSTIDNRDYWEADTDTHWSIDNIYLYNNSGVLTFNETKLNVTINALENDTIFVYSDYFNQNLNTSNSVVFQDVNVVDRLLVGHAKIFESSDGFSVANVNHIHVDLGRGSIILGGFADGEVGQVLHIAVTVLGDGYSVTLEHAEGTAEQKVFLRSGVDEVLTDSYGGWNLVCDGTSWYDTRYS